MKSKLKHLALLSAATFTLGANVFAKSKAKNDYDSNYYESEGPILMKVRAMGVSGQSKPKGYPAPVKASPGNESKLLNNGFGIQGATSVFFTDHLGAELAFGGMMFKVSHSALKAAQSNYGISNASKKKKDTFGIPMELLAQFHVAPYGAVRPYVGIGYNATYFITQSKDYKVAASFGPVYQAGFDLVLGDDSMINIDVKQYSMEPKVTYKSTITGKSDVSGKQKLNPIAVSVGMGWKF